MKEEKILIKFFIFFIAIIFLSLKTYAHGTLIINGVEHDEGFIDVKIYTDKESFLKEKLAAEIIRKKATKDQTVVPLSKVHEGTIAIVVYHDEDSNGELKTGLFWRPKEGFAFSNNYTPKGLPKFKKASIELIHGDPVIIELNY
tara:strand:+ start:166 stop:597 length:432 start_codon:yes stop_codon:yes gene_type:complete